MRPAVASLSLPLCALALLVGCSSNNPSSVFGQIEVEVSNPGGGNGGVLAPDPNVQIDCQFTAGTSTPFDCKDIFPDAGGGGVFTLEATPAAGSSFAGWTGCSSENSTICTLTFATSFDTSFSVTAQFDLINSVGVNLLANPGFETAVTVATSPTSTGHWQGDSAYSVILDQGIMPRSGNQMLRFQRSGLLPGAGVVSSQQWQLVDVSTLASEIDAGKIRMDASIWFNRVTGDAQTDTRFDLRVLTFTGTPANFPADYASPAHITAGSILTTSNSWQTVALADTLPAGTRYLAVEIYAFENVQDDATDPEFDGHYADDASLVLTQLP